MTESAVPTWSVKRKRLVSALLVFHLIAILSAPLATPPPVSKLSQSLRKPFKWYLQAVYMNHGYRFFNAVQATTIIRYELTMPDGTVRKERFADRDREWPRLYYHRHLMLGETMVGALVSLEPLAQFQQRMRDEVDALLDLRRAGYERLADRIQRNIERNEREYMSALKRRNALVGAVADYLLKKHSAVNVKIFVQEHRLLTREDVETGAKLGSDEFYKERLGGEFEGPL